MCAKDSPSPTALITDGQETPPVPGRVLVPLALFDFRTLGKWGRQDEEKRLSCLIACIDNLLGPCLETEHKGVQALTSRSLQASARIGSQNGDETVQCGPRAWLVGMTVSGTGAQGET